MKGEKNSATFVHIMEAEWEGLNESDYFLIRTKVDHRILVVMITFFLRKFSLRGEQAFRSRNVKPSARHKFGAGEEQVSDAQFAKKKNETASAI